MIIRSEEFLDNQVKKWFQVLAIFSVSITAFNAATLFYWTSPSIPVILEEEIYNTNLDEASYLTVIPPLAMVVGSPFYAILMNIWGRKYVTLTIGILHMIAWLLIAFSRSMITLYVSRFISGFADAGLFAVVPIYIAEISTPSIRSSWGNIMMVLIYLGQFVVNAVGYYFDLKTTGLVLLIFPVIFLFMFGLMPETPYYFLMKKKELSALNSLKRLRQTQNVDDEFKQIKQDVERQLSESGSVKDLLTSSSNRRAILVSTSVRAIQQFSGISAFALYTQFIFGEAIGSLDKGQSAMIYTGMLAFSNILGSIALDKLGRNLAMVVSCSGCTIALFGEAAYFYLQQNTTTDLSAVTWIPIVGMSVYVIFFSIGLSTVPTLIVGELFSASIKSKATCLMNVIFAIFIALSTKLFQVLISNFGMYVPFTFFGVCAFVGIFISRYIVPETKGKTLEEIQQTLKK